jgi:hypothetical protein
MLPNGLEIAKHPVGEPPGQLFDSISKSFAAAGRVGSIELLGRTSV